MACVGPITAQQTAHLCWMANIKKQHLKGEGIVKEVQEDPLKVVKLLPRTVFPFVSHVTSIALGRKRHQGLNEAILPGNKWPGSSQGSRWDRVLCPDMPDLLCALNWKILCKFMDYNSDQDFFPILLLKGKCHHELHNLGSGLLFPYRWMCCRRLLLFFQLTSWVVWGPGENTLLSWDFAFPIYNDSYRFYLVIFF